MTARQELSLQQHPLSAAFPAMPENELGALALDIEAHGQREPGVIFEGMVLDGWHRYLACEKAGIEFRCAEFYGADPVAFVLSRNLHRRHLTASQRAAAVVAAHKWRPHGDQSRSVPGTDRTTKEMAKAAEVSPSTIEHAKAAETAGLGDAVRDGLVSAKDAARIAKGEPAPKPKVIVAEPKFEKLYEEVKAELVETREKRDELADIAAELNDKLAMYEATEPDEQQKMIAELQLSVRRKDVEIDRQRVMIRDANNKNNELIRTVKRLQKKAGIGQ